MATETKGQCTCSYHHLYHVIQYCPLHAAAPETAAERDGLQTERELLLEECSKLGWTIDRLRDTNAELLAAGTRISRDIYAIGAAGLSRMADMDALDAAIAHANEGG